MCEQALTAASLGCFVCLSGCDMLSCDVDGKFFVLHYGRQSRVFLHDQFAHFSRELVFEQSHEGQYGCLEQPH